MYTDYERPSSIKALRRDSSGVCTPVEIAIDADGTPLTTLGERCERIGETTVRGWGDLDGDVAVWQAPDSAWAYLVK